MNMGRLSGQTAPSPPAHLRSCVVCHQRKVKCDRQQPCSNCARAGCECLYPSGRGRAPKRNRMAVDTKLMDKLSRLESIIKRMASENNQKLDVTLLSDNGEDKDSLHPPPSPPLATHAQDDRALSTAASGRSSPDLSSVSEQFNHLVIDKTKSYYVSNPVWSMLSQEIEELKDILLSPGDDDQDKEGATWSESSSSVAAGPNASLFGFRAIAHSLHGFHPSLSQAVNLLSLFSENVAPMLRIFHMPTLTALYWDAIASLDTLDKNIEALVFAIYYAAIVSIPTEQCMALLGMPREVALERYRFAVEQAIARADLLNTQSMVLLQAVVLFLSALRNQIDNRTTWSLSRLVFHIARAMGIHRDGTVFGLKPFETELRRRLWWHICVLDGGSSEQHGFEALLFHMSFDTRVPLNINDADLFPDMTEPPVEREGATEMTFCRIRCEAISLACKLGGLYPSGMVASSIGKAKDKDVPHTSLEERATLLRDLEQTLWDKYLRYCDESSPILLFSSMVCKVIIAHFWQVLYHPLMPAAIGGATPIPASTSASASAPTPTPTPAPALTSTSTPASDNAYRDQRLRRSIEVLELSVRILQTPAIAKWTWYSKTHIHWHAVAFVLSEICRRPPSAECDHAWRCVVTMYEAWQTHACEVESTLWRPVRRLMAKARYVREMQALGRNRTMGTAAGGAGGVGTSFQATTTTTTTTPEGISEVDLFSSPMLTSPLSQPQPQQQPMYLAANSTTMGTGGAFTTPTWAGSGPSISVGPAVPAADAGIYPNSAFNSNAEGMETHDALMELLNLPDDLQMDHFFGSFINTSGDGFSPNVLGPDPLVDWPI